MPVAALASVAALRGHRGLERGRDLPSAAGRDRAPFGLATVDAAFDGGGLPATGAHEIAAGAPGDATAASAFALGLTVRLLARKPGRSALVVQAHPAAGEGGLLYGPGLHALGVDPDRLVLVSARDDAAVLRVVDEAVRSGAAAVTVAEFSGDGAVDLKTTRRFNLAGERTGAAALLLTPRPAPTSAALTRWRVTAARGRPPAPGLIGGPAIRLDLTRNRHGRTGAWTVEWNLDERLFQLAEDAVPLARPPAHGPFGPGRHEFEDDADGRLRAVG